LKKIGLISDTHGFLDERIPELFGQCDEIWHAGDIGNLMVTDALSKISSLKAVHGNIDGGKARVQFPEYHFFELEGVRVLIIHIAGSVGKGNPRLQEIVAAHGTPDMLVCGHSHILKVQKDARFKWLYVNPGAAGIHGFHHMRTCLRLELNAGNIQNLEVIELGKRGVLK
jgi:uncharacterized protein